jgi:carboxylate-amine ligase
VKAPSLTLGIEEEYQIIDPETGELRSYIQEILQGDTVKFQQIKPEFHQSIVEVGSTVCSTPAQLRDEVVRLRRTVYELASDAGLTIAAAGTHPFSSWLDQEITPLERYVKIQEDLQEIARKNLIFGMHVHVGIEDRDFLIDAMNVARYFLPHLLCLSTSSPFWQERNTGLKSYRSVVWRNFPRTGIPRVHRSWAAYQAMVDSMVRAGSIPDASKIWWDLRPHPVYDTLEFRVCDICTRVDEAICIAALFQAIVAKLWKLRRDNMTFRIYPAELIEENKWRAVRYGLDGKLIDLGTEEEKDARELLDELIDWFLDDVIDELGSRDQVRYAYTIMDGGTSADRQLARFEEAGNGLKPVVEHVVGETLDGVL